MGARAVTELVGRDTELARVAKVLDEVVEAGRAAVALIAGEARVGKSRLVAVLSGLAKERGVAVSVGRCLDTRGVDLAVGTAASSHASNILGELDVTDRVEAAAVAQQAGLGQ